MSRDRSPPRGGGDRGRQDRISLLVRNLPLDARYAWNGALELHDKMRKSFDACSVPALNAWQRKTGVPSHSGCCRAEDVRHKFEKYGRVRDVYLPRECCVWSPGLAPGWRNWLAGAVLCWGFCSCCPCPERPQTPLRNPVHLHHHFLQAITVRHGNAVPDVLVGRVCGGKGKGGRREGHCCVRPNSPIRCAAAASRRSSWLAPSARPARVQVAGRAPRGPELPSSCQAPELTMPVDHALSSPPRACPSRARPTPPSDRLTEAHHPRRHGPAQGLWVCGVSRRARG